MNRNMLKRSAAVLCLILLLLGCFSVAAADRMPEEKPYGYMGAMRVQWCKEWISLRLEPRRSAPRLAKIPLGDIVYSCLDIKDELFVRCEYQGQTGYVLKQFLKRAPECEPPLSSAVTKKMSLEEVIGTGEVVMDWKDYNMSVVAAHDVIRENRKNWEVLRIGCFIDGSPIWGHEEKLEITGDDTLLKVFIGGLADDWQVILFDGGYGLTMLDLISGKEKWTVSVGNCPMGNAAAFTVDKNGTMYLAGTNGPDPVAISLDGRVLWQAEVSNEDVYDPYEISVENSNILVKYHSGMTDGYKLVTFDQYGDLVSIRNQIAKTE